MFETKQGFLPNVGWWLVFLGGASLLLNFLGADIRFLNLLDHWGEMIGRAIRVSMIVLGSCILYSYK